jgi:polar amino acid transport system ATP-binding protein
VASTIVFMHEGKIWETGEPEAMFDNPRTAEFRTFASRNVK